MRGRPLLRPRRRMLMVMIHIGPLQNKTKTINRVDVPWWYYPEAEMAWDMDEVPVATKVVAEMEWLEMALPGDLTSTCVMGATERSCGDGRHRSSDGPDFVTMHL